MGRSIVKEKGMKLAIEIVFTCREIQENKREYVLTKHLLRSGTSIGANISEAQNAQSRKDFIAKLSIAKKETNETLYWLELFSKTQLIPKEKEDYLVSKTSEIHKMLSSIIKTCLEKE
ncbi:MAG: four helix bundle protein [Bacteroidetes bacterium]|nr:MAG: four helix bundle protein [Bacteroidota bacterium]